jgi:hypothetical protein
VIRQPAGQAVHADAIRASSRRRVFVCICHEAHARVIAKSRVFPGGRIEGDLRVLACFGGSTEVRDDEGAGGVPTKVVRRKAEPQCTFCLEHLECTRISYPVLARCDEQRKVERGRGHHVWAARFGGQRRSIPTAPWLYRHELAPYQNDPPRRKIDPAAATPPADGFGRECRPGFARAAPCPERGRAWQRRLLRCRCSNPNS